MTEHVRTEVAAGIMTLTLTRADKKNALSNAMYSAMSDGLERAEQDPAIRVVLFQGDGDSFTSGNDLADFSAQANGKNASESQAFRFINNLGKATRPLVAAVQGNAVGVGTTMLLHCDLVFLADTARLMTPFVNLARRRHRAGCCLRASATSAPTPCLRWDSRSMPLLHWPVAWPMPWCRPRSCEPEPGKPPKP